MKRGPSQAAKAAEKYLTKHPGTKASELAAKFGINLTTVYRSQWWKDRVLK